MKFSCFFPTKFVSFVFHLSLQLFLCYPRECRHLKTSKKTRLCCCVFSKSPGGHAISRPKHLDLPVVSYLLNECEAKVDLVLIQSSFLFVWKLCLNNRVFSLTWPASMQICWNKRKRLRNKRVQLPEDWFRTPTWPSFHCFGTPIWLPWRYVKRHDLHNKAGRVVSKQGQLQPRFHLQL